MGNRDWGSELDKTPAVPLAIVPSGTVVATKHPTVSGLVYCRMYEWISYPSEAPVQKYRDDPNDPEEEVKERPATWWSPRSIGFRARILVNPLGGELRIRERKLAAWLAGSSDEKDYLETIKDAVIAWDYVIVDQDGNRTEIDPPSVGGWDRFLDLPSEAFTWLTSEIRTAHLPKAPKSPTPSLPPVGITDLTSPTQTDPETALLES